ncbi:hypothetical protein BC628DRAFT_1329142 [Trametes gibbosa]|uniref:Matrin-type domain-containing protein n=1 Tax=Trametes gibbosa TaxID=160864 RepID=A0A6G6FQL8_9APHY|nr:hypothetical protein BC628DRAFT_1329142 [Trametes gibbosa]QIE48599.1 hypothetical protein [Trametes gibbosa]
MSEYWVAHKKYFCKYCNIYIADDAPSRKQHESGLRHKGNVERFVRGLYKAGEKRKHDLEEEKRDMARVEKAAQAAYAQDVEAGLVKPGSSSAVAGPSSAVAAPKTAGGPKPSNPYANYSTAESLGFTDPDEERRKAEAERRRKEGVAGDWEVVEVVQPSLPGSAEKMGVGNVQSEEGGAWAGEKRPAEQPLDEEDTRGWKLRRKKVNVGLDDLYDPGTIPIKLKAKKEETMDQSLALQGSSGASSSGGLIAPGGSEKPRWSARGWNKPGTSHNASESIGHAGGPPDGGSPEDTNTEPEEKSFTNEPFAPPPDEPPALAVKTEAQEPVKPEPTDEDAPLPVPAGSSLFKKRKAPAAGGSRGGRRF